MIPVISLIYVETLGLAFSQQPKFKLLTLEIRFITQDLQVIAFHYPVLYLNKISMFLHGILTFVCFNIPLTLPDISCLYIHPHLTFKCCLITCYFFNLNYGRILTLSLVNYILFQVHFYFQKGSKFAQHTITCECNQCIVQAIAFIIA